MAKNYLQQLQQIWARLLPKQRFVVVAGVLASLLAIGAVGKTFSTPEYKPLVVGLDPGDAQAIENQLAAKKIEYRASSDGKGIDVAADQLDAARLEVASQDNTHSGRLGFELFDKTTWGQTEFDERVNYQRALEGELERTIQSLNGVKSARVHLVLPTPSIFLDRERTAKASVTLRMRHGSLTQDQLESIARLVSGAVDDLSPHDVVIVDGDTNEYLGNRSGGLEGRELEGELTKRLMATLGPAVGLENLRASVNVEYDNSSTEESQDKYDPSVSAVLSSQKTSEQAGGGASVGGVAGTSSNLPANTPGAVSTTDVAMGQDGTQSSSSENATFGVNKVVRHTLSPAGRIRRITAAILVNDAQDGHVTKGQWIKTPRKRTIAQLQQITDLAKGVLGTDMQRGDIVTVQNMSFDDPATAEVPPSFLDKVNTQVNGASKLIRYAAMLLLFVLVWALMFRPMQKEVVASLRELGKAGTNASLPEVAQRSELNAGGSTAAIESEAESTQLKRELGELIQQEPASMARTLQAWLREDTA